MICCRHQGYQNVASFKLLKQSNIFNNIFYKFVCKIYRINIPVYSLFIFSLTCSWSVSDFIMLIQHCCTTLFIIAIISKKTQKLMFTLKQKHLHELYI